MITAATVVFSLGLGMQAPAGQGVLPQKAAAPFLLNIKGGVLGTAEIQAKQVETKAIVERLKAELKIPIVASALVAQQKLDLEKRGTLIALLLELAPVVLADIEVSVSPDDSVWRKIHLIGYNEKEPARDLRPSGFLLAAGTIKKDGTISAPEPDADLKKEEKVLSEEPEDPELPRLSVVVKEGRVSVKARKQLLVALLNEVAQKARIPFDIRGAQDMSTIDIDLADLPLRDLPVALGRPEVRLVVRRNLATGEEFVQGILAAEKRLPTQTPRAQ